MRITRWTERGSIIPNNNTTQDDHRIQESDRHRYQGNTLPHLNHVFRPWRFYCQPQSQSLSSGLLILVFGLEFETWIWDLDLGLGFRTWIWDWTWAWQLHCTDMYKSQIQKLISYVLLCNTKVTYILSPSIALVCSKSYKYFNTIIKKNFLVLVRMDFLWK